MKRSWLDGPSGLAAGCSRLASALLISALTAATAPAQVVSYYHLDAVGNVRAVTNQAGQIVEQHRYLPFGEEWCTGPPAGICSGVTSGQPKRFTGKERDPETGLDYFGARYYRANIGRFTTVDPVFTWRANLADPQRWNRYGYAKNNPLRYVDPDGNAPVAIAVPKGRMEANARIRAEVAKLFGAGSSNQGPYNKFQEVVADAVLAGLLPKNAQEYKEALVSSAFGMVAPLAAVGEKTAAITMDQAVARGAKHVGAEGVMEVTGKGTNFQFRSSTTNAAGQLEQRISRFDINPADAHVAAEGPHLNLEVQVNGKPVRGVDPHTPIDPKTVRPGDHP